MAIFNSYVSHYQRVTPPLWHPTEASEAAQLAQLLLAAASDDGRARGLGILGA